MVKFFASDLFNFEFLRILGTSPTGGAEIGECLEAAKLIKDGNAESWYRAWKDEAQTAEMRGKEALTRGDRESARWAFLRASNYYRASEFFLHCQWLDPRLQEATEKSRKAFKEAVSCLDGKTYLLEIPWQDQIKLPGYLFVPPTWNRKGGKLPILILISGFDNTQEELYFYAGAGAIARGYAVMTFEGPGQGIVLRRDKLTLRPDWEVVTSRVLDYLQQFADINPDLALDMDRIGTFGASMGGYFALRAANDPRIKCCISCDGFYDLFEVARSRIPPWFINSWLSGYLGDGIFNGTVNILQKLNFQMRWEMSHGKWAFGVDSPAGVMREMQRYSLQERDGKQILASIRCPVLVSGAADTIYFPPDQNASVIFLGLKAIDKQDKELWIAHGADNGGLQAKVGAISVLHQKVFAWLDDHLGVDRM